MNMMEAMQMGPATYGPQIVGPGAGSIGGCVFEASIGSGAYSRIKKDNQKAAENAMVVDAATAFSEQNGEIGHYKLLARNTRYRDKITDEIISEKTLVSPDFNYEAAGVWTSAGEKDTVGTIEEYSSTVERARELAQIDGNASMFWVSPSTDGEVHRAYLWVKKDDEVDAYQYIIPGRIDAVSAIMKKMGYQNDDRKPLGEQTIVRLGTEPEIHHKDVFNAVVSSLSSGEAMRAKSILDKFRQEIELPDSLRIQRLKNYQVEYTAKLNSENLEKVYGNDIEKWLKSIAQGFAAINRIDGIDGISESIVNDNRIVGDQLKADRAAHLDYQRGENIRVLQPIISGIIGLTGIIVNTSTEQVKEHSPIITDFGENGVFNGKEIENPNKNFGGLFETAIGDIDFSSESLFWQNFIFAVFEPIPDSGYSTNRQIASMNIKTTSFQKNTEGFIQTDEKTEFSNGEGSIKDALMQFFPLLDADKEDEFQQSLNKEGLPVLVSCLQQGSEVIAAIIKSEENIGLVDGKKEEITGQQKIEAEVVKIGGEIIVAIFKDKHSSQKDTFTQLVFLLHVYHDKNTSIEVKQIIATMIYRQIEIMYVNEDFFIKFPQLETVFEKFQKLSPQAKFLEDRFAVLLSNLEKLYSTDIFYRGIKSDQDLLRKMLFLIVKIMQLPERNEDFSGQGFTFLSFERLRSHNLNGNNSHNLSFHNHKKNVKKLAQNGIIYIYPIYLFMRTYDTCFVE